MNRKRKYILLTLMLTLMLALGTGTAAGAGHVSINEIRIDQPSTDNDEYFELAGTPGDSLDGLTYIVIGDGSAGSGVVEHVTDLNGQTIPLSGYFVAAESTFSLGTADLTTSLNFENSDNVTHMLVSGFTGAKYDDLDTDNDGTLDSTPWAAIVDSIALIETVGSGDQTYGDNSVGPDGSYVPGHAYNCTGGWQIGGFTLGTDDTPGAANNCPYIPVAVTINEARIDQPGSDYDEYFELAGAAGTSLDGLTYLVIGDGYGGSGVIENVTDLSGQSIPASGYFVAAESSFSLGTADLTTTLNFENSDNVTHLLVDGFTGSNGDDLDTDNDGTLDSTPWTAVIDSVAFIESFSSGEKTYSDNTVGPDGYYVPAQIYLCDDGWQIGSFSIGTDTPGAENACGGGVVTVFGSCGDPATPISMVQGDGLTSPLYGVADVVIEGVVVGDYNSSSQLRGFYLQEEDGDADGDPATSEGIFVYDNGSHSVDVGDVVRVQGKVTEYYDLTELTYVSNLAVCDSGVGVTAASVTLPVSNIDDWEAVEGMLVTIPQTLYATDNYNLGRYGEVSLSVDDRLYTPTNVVAPGAPAIALQDLNDRSRILLDDASNWQNPPTVPYLDPDNTLRAGDTIPSLTGVLSYAYGVYRMQPVGEIDFTRENHREATPADVGGTLKIASFNVLNYFTTIDNSGPICGPVGGLDCRGADTADEFTRQRDKIISAIAAMDADVVGLMELENNTTAAIQDLVDGLNAVVGAGTYDFIDTGTIGTDAIRVAFIYQPGSVTPVGPYAVLDSSVDPTFIDTKNRPALAQTFRQNSTAAVFTAVVNHFKSKGSDCNSLGDPDTGDGQGNCNLTRTAAATALTNWLAGDPTGSGDPDFLIMGDLNAYAMEDPIAAIESAGYTNLIEAFVGADAYSYVFYGQAGYLDHALANASLTAQVSGVTEWHINADEPSALNYNNYNQDFLYNPDPYRSSDHDPVIVGTCLVPVLEVSVSTDALWPANHEYVTVTTSVNVSNDDPNVTLTLVSVESNEPDDANGNGDGNTTDDIVIVDDFTFDLRAERAATGSGRVYTITYEITDSCGNTVTATATVSVPLNQGNQP